MEGAVSHLGVDLEETWAVSESHQIIMEEALEVMGAGGVGHPLREEGLNSTNQNPVINGQRLGYLDLASVAVDLLALVYRRHCLCFHLDLISPREEDHQA